MSNDKRNINLVNIGSRIQKRRQNLKLTQEQVAERVGITQKHLSRIEKGYHNPHFDMIIALAKVLDVPVDAFAEDFEDENVNIFLQLIKDDVKEMSKQQLNMLRENIEVIKKFDF